MTRQTLLLAASVAALTLVSARAFAQELTEAETLFQDGRAASRSGDWTTACAKFAASHQLDPKAGTTLNLARCEEMSGRLTRALSMYRGLASRLAQDDERIQLVEERTKSLEARVGRLTIRAAPGAGVGASIERDGEPVDVRSLGEPIALDPGRHVVVVKVAGRADRSYDVTIGTGESRDLVVEAGDLRRAIARPVQVQAPPAPPQSGGTTMRTMGFITAGVGLTGLVASAITGIVVLDRKADVARHCANYECDQIGYDAARSGETLSTASTVLFAIGGVALAGGAVLIAAAPSPATRGAQATLSGRLP